MPNIAAAQMRTQKGVDENFKSIEYFLEGAKEKEAHFLVLPEECLTLRMSDKDKLLLSKQYKSLERRFSTLAKTHQSWIVAGTLPCEADESHYYSTTIVFDDKGEIRARYQKIHLFDVQVQDDVSYCESKTVMPGEEICVFDSPLGRIGLSICYDVRFPLLYNALSKQGAQLLLVPSAFTPQTGEVHWEVLLKARAIENLCYVVAPNQNGERLNGEGTYGHSRIISPWGEVLAGVDEGQAMIVSDINLQYLKTLRQRFPVLGHQKAFKGVS